METRKKREDEVKTRALKAPKTKRASLLKGPRPAPIFAQISDSGLGRRINEDSVLVRTIRVKGQKVLMAVVCDGVGGMFGGLRAGEYVARGFDEWMKQYDFSEVPGGHGRSAGGNTEGTTLKDIGKEWKALLERLNKELIEQGNQTGLRICSTVSALLVFGDRILIAQVGDSRIYYASGGQLYQLTHDQTLGQEKLYKGEVAETQDEYLSDRKILRQAVGGNNRLRPVIFEGKSNGGLYLVCTDGFYEKLTDAELREALSPSAGRMNGLGGLSGFGGAGSPGLRRMLENMVDMSLRRGIMDNLSAVLIRTGA